MTRKKSTYLALLTAMLSPIAVADPIGPLVIINDTRGTVEATYSGNPKFQVSSGPENILLAGTARFSLIQRYGISTCNQDGCSSGTNPAQDFVDLAVVYEAFKEEMRRKRDRWQAISDNLGETLDNDFGEPDPKAALANLLGIGLGIAAQRKANRYDKLYKDPPRFDYELVFEYDGYSPIDDLVWDITDPFFDSFNSISDQFDESLEGYLASLERLQGAVADVNGDGFAVQFEALELFSTDSVAFESSFAAYIATLPLYYSFLGVDDFEFHDSTYFSYLYSIGDEFGVEPLQVEFVPLGDDVAAVPEPGTLVLLGIGLAGIGLMRRRRRV